MTEEENEKQEPATAQVDLGKFQNVDALMHAYKELEAEFTRRSQRLRALEAASAKSDAVSSDAAQTNSGVAVRSDEASPYAAQPKRADADEREALYRAVKGDEEVCARIAGEYIASCKGVPLLAGGGTGVTAPVKRARTFRDAGNMALEYFKNQK